jgi:hypothetical protein
MTDLASQPAGSVRRGWLILAATGVALVTIALAAIALVMLDKPHFGNLVGPSFLPAITIGIFVGAILLAIGAWGLPSQPLWRKIVLLAWAVVALTSPLFGLMFLLPLGVLVLTLPLVAWILAGFRRAR